MEPQEFVPIDRLETFTRRVFRAVGFTASDARHAMDVLMWASLHGIDTHGIRNLKRYYVDCTSVGWRDGKIVTNAVLTTDHETETTAALNANGGLGLSVAVRAMQLAIRKATEYGVGVVTVRNSTHFGAAGYHAQLAIPHDMLGFAATGYLFPHGQEKAVVPFGGLLPMLSTNPLAMACPADALPPFLLDMSTSVVPVNRIEMLATAARSIPIGWALDAEHQPTTDPASVAKMVPLGGSQSWGGHKGFGLSIAVWILSGLLSGGWRSNPQPDRVLGGAGETQHGFGQEGIGHAFAAIRLDQFGDPAAIKRGLDAMILAFNESPPVPGFDRVLVPGQIEFETQQQRRRTGIPIAQTTLAELQSLAEQFQIPW